MLWEVWSAGLVVMIVVADRSGGDDGRTKEFAKRQKDRQTETDILSHALDNFFLCSTRNSGWSQGGAAAAAAG